jgi:hypothetical protein
MMEQTSANIDFERFQPIDDDDRNRRALFYCHCLNLYGRRILELLINRVDAGEFGESVRDQLSSLGDWQVEAASKIWACINLHIAGLDHGGADSPAWLLYFFSEAMQEADELFTEPPAIEVIARHGSFKRERMIKDVAAHIADTLGLKNDREKLLAEIAGLLQASTPYRAELLTFALSQPPEALRNHLEMLGG